MGERPKNPSFIALPDEISRVGQFPVVEVHVPLRRADVGVAQQPPGIFDSLLPAGFRSALVARQIQNQIPWQAGVLSKAGVRPTEVGNAPALADWGQEHRAVRAVADGRVEETAILLGGI